MAVDKETIAEIKNSVNIVDVIGEVVSLSKAGRNYLGLCPFHKEKTPSFNVIEDRQFFHCFGCGKSGDVFKFIEEYRQVSFLESVRIVAERSGISVQVETTPQQNRSAHPNQALLDIHQDAAKFYHAVLMTTKVGQEARAYLAERGMTDQLLEEFNIGLAPDEADFFYRQVSSKDKYDEVTLTNSGLFNFSEENNRIYDAFRNRIMFPLTDDSGHVIAFSGRIWTQADSEQKLAKYKNSRSTPIFNKSYEMYHLDKAKAVATKQREIYLMEGFMDVIAAYQAGVENAVASMGTALTPEHVQHLKKFTKKVILTYDGDNAGQNAIAKSLEILSDMQVEIVRVPNQMDPDEFLQKNSPEALRQLLEQSRVSSVEFFIHYLKPDNIDNLQAEIAYVEKIARIIVQSPSITAQNAYINMVAELLPDYDYFQVEQAVNNQRLSNRSAIAQETKQTAMRVVDLPVSKSLTAVVKAETQLMHRLLHHDYLLNEFRNRDDFSFDTPELQELYFLLKKQGEISTIDLNQMDEPVRLMYYRVLEENLPKEIANNEIEAIEHRRKQFLQEREMHRHSKQVRESSNHGDTDQALLALQQLIAQKRNME